MPPKGRGSGRPGGGEGRSPASRTLSRSTSSQPPTQPVPPPAAPQVLRAPQRQSSAPTTRGQFPPAQEIVDLPARPGYAREGRAVTVYANHFRIDKIPNFKVYQYAFTIPTKDGDAPAKGLAQAVWESDEVKTALGQFYTNLIFNGRSICWSRDRIHNIPTIEVQRGKLTLKVNFVYATEFNLSDLTAFINRQRPNSSEISQCLTFLNQVIADSLTKSSRYVAVGRKYFPRHDDEREISRVDQFSLLEFRRGFYQAVHWGGNNGLTINVNVTTGIFWNSQMHTMVDLALRIIRHRSDEGNVLSNLHENHFRMISRTLRGLKFFIKYRGVHKEKQVHMATGVSKETARGKRFEVDGQSLSVAEYFQRTYNLRLRYPDAPLIKKGDNYFPMEVCYIVPLQRFPQKLDGSQAAAMIKFASKLAPEVRKRDVEFKVRSLGWHNDPTLTSFGLTVTPQMTAVPARILQHPRLAGGSDMGGGASFEPRSGKWDLRGYRLKKPKTLSRWGILVLDDQRRFSGPQNPLNRFISTLASAADDYGMRVDRTPVIVFGNFNAPQQAIHRSCDELYTKIEREYRGAPELLMFIIKGKGSVIYEIVKQYCDTIRGVQSQGVDSVNVQRKCGDRAFHANLLLKMNSKLGGTTVTLQNPITDSRAPTMFIGADVSHAAAGSKAPSLATMVGSVDFEGVHYACPLPLNQNNREESIMEVRSMVTELVNIYKRNTGAYPVRVMYFRDGVAEGQFDKVKAIEVAAIKETIGSMSGKAPTVTAIVVRKRNHTRLFPKEGEGDRGSRGNVFPGTVVDQDITHPTDWDFYLVPHSSIQGTARPAHYYVIHDDHRLNADFVQRICYQMSYVYQRSSGAVSLHPAVYYAHLAGNRARAHDPSRDRDDSSSSSNAGDSEQMQADTNVPRLRPIHPNVAASMWWM